MHKIYVLIFAFTTLLFTLPCFAQDYDFSAVAPSGQTLYYKILPDACVEVVGQYNDGYPNTILTGNVIVPDTVQHNGVKYLVTNIGYQAFYLCTLLTSLSIPNSVMSIGDMAFYGCTSLTDIQLPDSLFYFGSYIFTNCSSLTSIAIPNGLIYIANAEFMNCSSLINVTIPFTVESIGSSAFEGCTSLTNLTIPDSVISIGNYAFSNCTSLINVTLPCTITSLGEGAFHGCSSLIDISIPNTVNQIAIKTFQGCTSLNTVNIPNSVRSIGHSAFSFCSSLTNISIPNSVVFIGENAFGYCSSLEDIVLDSPITNIEAYTFVGCNSLDSIIIPNTVVSIGYQAFCWCTSLTNVVIPNSVTTIGNGAFSYCTSLISVFIPNSVISIQDFAFNNCTSLQNLTMPNSLSSVNAYVFSYCSSLSTVVLPNSVTTIGEGAFSFCTSLSSIAIPNTVTYIAEKAFQYCSALSQIIIPELITAVENYTFEYCTSLELVSLHRSIQSLGFSSFYGACPDTLNVYWDSPISVNNGNNSLLNASVINIPCGTRQNYQNVWGMHNYCEPDADFSFVVLSSDSTRGLASVIPQNGNDVTCTDSLSIINATPLYGYHFTHWSNGRTANPDTLQLAGDSTVTAYFSKNMYSVVCDVDDDSMGMVTGSDTVEYLDSIVIEALPYYGYHFVQWDDGNADNPRQVLVTQNENYTAYFYPNQYSVVLNVDDVANGTVIGAGTYNYHSQVNITATPNYGYHFMQWSDGDTTNPRGITLMQDTSFTALFAKNLYTLDLYSNNDTIGVTNGSGAYEYLDTVAISATTIAAHHHFVRWDDGATDTVRTIVITDNINLTAIFAIDTHYVFLSVNDYSWGVVGGEGDYPYGSTAIVTASPGDGYYFVDWNNADISNPNSFVVTSDTLLTAFFSPEIIPSLCMVSVQEGHNVLMWEKEQTVLNYNIYREGNISGEYEMLASIAFDSLSSWTDTSSRPNTRSYRYKLSATDIHAHEAEGSGIHKTMHLTISQGIGNLWNLVWSEYEGADYATYVIYRGTNAFNIQQIDVMPAGGNTTYTDDSAPEGDVYYQVGILLSSPCNPSKSTNIVLSNVATNSSVGVREHHMENVQAQVTNGVLCIQSNVTINKLSIYDIKGKLLKVFPCNGDQIKVDVSNLSSGVYIAYIQSSNGVCTTKKVIIR